MRQSSTIGQVLKSIGYDMISQKPVGEDPGTHSLRSIVIGKVPEGYYRKPYAVWNCIDWRTAWDKNDRKRGIELCDGKFGLE